MKKKISLYKKTKLTCSTCIVKLSQECCGDEFCLMSAPSVRLKSVQLKIYDIEMCYIYLYTTSTYTIFFKSINDKMK